MAHVTFIQPTATGAVKSIPLNALPPEAWTSLLSAYGDVSDVFKLYQMIPWLYRAVELRASSVANLPYAWEWNGDEKEEEDVLGSLPFKWNHRHIMNLLEGWLTLYGHAYVLKSANLARSVREVRPLHPQTMKPRYDDNGELLGFTRSLQGAQTELTLDEVVYIWRPARDSENGYGTAPAKAALAASGVLSKNDMFLDAYMEQGPIMPTLVSVEGMPAPSDMEKLQSWLERTLIGIKNAFRPIAMRAGLKVDQLQPLDLSKLSLEDLSVSKREDIATALGVPLSLLMSNAANYATAQQDTFNFYDMTIEPEVKMISQALNEQLFEALGYMITPHKDRMQAYQEAEGKRVVEKLGPLLDRQVITINEAREELGMTPLEASDLPDMSEDENPPPNAPENDDADETTEDDETAANKALVALAQWQSKAEKRVGHANYDKALLFDSADIPLFARAFVESELPDCKSADDVRMLFSGAREWVSYP